MQLLFSSSIWSDAKTNQQNIKHRGDCGVLHLFHSLKRLSKQEKHILIHFSSTEKLRRIKGREASEEDWAGMLSQPARQRRKSSTHKLYQLNKSTFNRSMHSHPHPASHAHKHHVCNLCAAARGWADTSQTFILSLIPHLPRKNHIRGEQNGVNPIKPGPCEARRQSGAVTLEALTAERERERERGSTPSADSQPQIGGRREEHRGISEGARGVAESGLVGAAVTHRQVAQPSNQRSRSVHW